MSFQGPGAIDRRGFLSGALSALAMVSVPKSFGHDGPHGVNVNGLNVTPFGVDKKFGFHTPKADPGKPITGQGMMAFQMVQELDIPADLKQETLKAAHGTVMALPDGTIVWGLGNYGLIGYSVANPGIWGTPVRLTPQFPAGGFNLHGGEIFFEGPYPMFAIADDGGGRVFVGNLGREEVTVIPQPPDFKGAWKPTDVAIYSTDLNEQEPRGPRFIAITNGYGHPPCVHIYDRHLEKYTAFFDVSVNGQSQTAHGITTSWLPQHLKVSQRAAGIIEVRSLADPLGAVVDRIDIGSGVLPCDSTGVETPGATPGQREYFECVPLLRGPQGSPGAVAIIGADKKVRSLVKPQDLEGPNPTTQHIHDAVMFLAKGSSGQLELFMVVTSWNPGGKAQVLRMVNPEGHHDFKKVMSGTTK
jgi:hypothetical protein